MTSNNLAQRFQESRVRAGMTKTALAKPRYTVSYVSQIESGRRSPSPEALAFFSERLGVSPRYLATGVPEGLGQRLAFQVEEARLALRSEEPEEAERLARRILAESEGLEFRSITAQAKGIKGDALYRQGRPREAVDAYEEALEDGLSEREAGLITVALARTYRALGDLEYAKDLVESFGRRPSNGPLDSSVAAELQTVLVSIYFERGDVFQAERAARRALAAAEPNAPPEVRARAYWDASRVLAEAKRWVEAMEYATRARLLMESLDDRRRVARLHNGYAFICLELDPPRIEEAAEHLDRAEEILSETGSAPDLAYVYTERARLAMLEKRPDEALDLTERALLYVDSDPLEENRAMFLKGIALSAVGRKDEARDVLMDTALRFEKAGARQQVASCWREIGDLDVADGNLEAAVEAFRTGLEAIDPQRSRA